MTFEGLPPEVAAALLAKETKPKKALRADIVTECVLCNATLEMGYCMTAICDNNPYKGVQEHECPNCGYCETPGKCAWSVACPVCGAGVGLHCRQGHRVVGLHSERHEICISL